LFIIVALVIDLEEMIKTCHACQIMANPTQAPPVNTTKLLDRPWKKFGIDLTAYKVRYASFCFQLGLL
jgi:hypothetical protein